MAHEAVTLAERVDLGFEGEGGADHVRDALQVGDADAAAERIGEQVHHEHLARVGLGGGDALFVAGAHQQDVLGEARQGARGREDYNERPLHSALAMMAPARFARAWAQSTREGKVIPLTSPGKALRSPENTRVLEARGENHAETARGAGEAAPAALLRSPYGLPPQHGGSPNLHSNNNHQLSQQVDR